jgi:hypothetical protein
MGTQPFREMPLQRLSSPGQFDALINVLTVENQLLESHINSVQAQSRYPDALVALCFEPSRLISQDCEAAAVCPAHLSTFPSRRTKTRNCIVERKPPGKEPLQ